MTPFVPVLFLEMVWEPHQGQEVPSHTEVVCRKLNASSFFQQHCLHVCFQNFILENMIASSAEAVVVDNHTYMPTFSHMCTHTKTHMHTCIHKLTKDTLSQTCSHMCTYTVTHEHRCTHKRASTDPLICTPCCYLLIEVNSCLWIQRELSINTFLSC